MNCSKRTSILVTTLVWSTVLLPRPASACGGLFCSSSSPVDQSSERIIFSQNADDTVTAVIQIFYRGPSERFAWVLPVPGKPDVGVSTDAAFDALDDRTDPTYVLTREVAGRCAQVEAEFDDYGTDASIGPDENYESDADAGVAPEPVVSIEDRGNVGPYDFVVLSVDQSADEPEERLVEWLQENDYDVFSETASVIAPYIEDGLNLLAIKLTKDSQTGSIRPLRVTYESQGPSIPIRPTALAATPDMGVKVWLSRVR